MRRQASIEVKAIRRRLLPRNGLSLAADRLGREYRWGPRTGPTEGSMTAESLYETVRDITD